MMLRFDHAAIVAAYQRGMSNAWIQRRHGCSASVIYDALIEAKVPARTSRGRHKNPDDAGSVAPRTEPLLPWYTAPPVPSALERLIVREDPRHPIVDPTRGRSWSLEPFANPWPRGGRVF